MDKMSDTIREALESTFNAGQEWAETYQGWFIPRAEDHIEKRTKAIDAALSLLPSAPEEKCPKCDGQGWTAEHSQALGSHDPEGNCLGGCPVQVQCEACSGTGRAPKPAPEAPKEEEDINMRFEQTTDAREWAKAFVARFGGDEGLMIGWFANAIERGRMAGEAAHPAPAPSEEDALLRETLGAFANRRLPTWPDGLSALIQDMYSYVRPKLAAFRAQLAEAITRVMALQKDNQDQAQKIVDAEAQLAASEEKGRETIEIMREMWPFIEEDDYGRNGNTPAFNLAIEHYRAALAEGKP